MVRRFKMGRKRPKVRGPRLSLKNYLLRGVAAGPPTFDYTAKAMPALSLMYDNDTLGCHDASTEVLTEKGWQLWPEYDGKSLLGTMNQSSGLLEFQAPFALQRFEHDGPMFYADHKSLDFCLTPEHRMLQRPYVIPNPYVPGGAGYAEQRFTQVSALGHRSMIPASTTGFLGAKLNCVQIGSRTWDGDDLIALLALVLSDGYVSEANGHTSAVSFCCFREDRRDMVARLAHSLGINEQPTRRGVWKFTEHDLSAWIKANCYTQPTYKSLYKRVPDLVKVASQVQIDRFLKYFGDQSISKDGERAFFSSSQRMIDDLQELLLRVGRRGGIYSRPQRDSVMVKAVEGHMDITLTEWAKRDTGLSLLRAGQKGNLVRDHYKGEVFCASVPNSTLVTRRNGQILISGNCCVPACMGHLDGVFTGNASGTPVVFTDDQIVALYSEIGGYVPGEPSTDQGCDEVTALNIWQSKGLLPDGSHKIVGWVAVDATDAVESRTAAWLFENLVFGVELPDAWVNPTPDASGFVWDVAGDPNPDNGHCFGCCGWNAQGAVISTWGMLGTITYAAIAKYASTPLQGELYSVLSVPDSINAAMAKAPVGLDATQLYADLQAIGGSPAVNLRKGAIT